MAKKAMCAKVPKSHGEKTVILANKLKIVDNDLEIQSDGKFVYVPFISQPSDATLKVLKEQVTHLEVSAYVFPERKKGQTSLIELLEDKLSPHLLASLPRAIDFVGDIAMIEIPPELDAYKNVIGEAILKANRNVHTVLAKVGAVTGTYRLREFTVIAGEPRTETVHKEYGFQYHVDVAKAYFSPRLSFEHRRVASLVKEGETITDMFAGVGPFSIQIAKTHEKVKVYAIDLNPYAIEYLRKNIRLNRVVGKVHPILGDARKVVSERLFGVADRVIMNLPEKAIDYVDVACKATKSTGGVIHFYSFINASDSMENVKQSFTEAVEKIGRRVEKILLSRSVRETAPYEFQVVLDARIH
jgi:tRNA (guanine37-N1)-methyltransferase